MSELEYTEHGWRMTTDRGRHHREAAWDYKGRGVYHITLVVADHYPLFGDLAGETPDAAHIVLNNFGNEVLDILRGVPQYRKTKGYELKILASQIMPDHIHVIIQVVEPMPKSIGTIIGGFKSACTSLYKKTYVDNGGNHAAKMQNNPAEQTIDEHILHFSRMFTRIGSIWHPDVSYYHERILHNYDQLQPMIDYVHDNPRRLWLKRANPDLFRIKQDKPIAGLSCLVLGNIFLADNPQKAVLQCSRRMTQAEIDAKKEVCLQEAANGTIFVSGAISEGEKQICRALREAGYQLIILLTEGFPEPDSPHYKFYKPTGVYFEACAAGNLLLVQPDKAVLEQEDIVARVTAKVGDIPHDSQRFRFVAMNVIAEKIIS